MLFYRITSDCNEGVLFRGTLGAAHKDARRLYAKHQWPMVYIEEVDILTKKQNIVDILNGDIPLHVIKRSWSITTRGGLKEDEEVAEA